jgi:Na+-translocating ferredoxin:NAD+ oxidoreductase subunit B
MADLTVVWAMLLALAGMGLVFGLGLAIAERRFRHKQDARVDQVAEMLPGVDCGGCGLAGCRAYAEALVAGKIGPCECVVGGQALANLLAAFLGLEGAGNERLVARLRCNGRAVADKYRYLGVPDCRAAALLHGGPRGCAYGCIRLGTCAMVCPADAIVMEDGFPRVIESKCIACGKCVRECPKNLYVLHPVSNRVYVACSSHDTGVVTRRTCDVGCIACMRCVKVCPVDAAHVTNCLASLDPAKCINCGACVAACPTHCILDKRPKPAVTATVAAIAGVDA